MDTRGRWDCSWVMSDLLIKWHTDYKPDVVYVFATGLQYKIKFVVTGIPTKTSMLKYKCNSGDNFVITVD
jgi:hypothetical protein